MSEIIICGVSKKGKWGKPKPAKELKWVSEITNKEVKPPKTLSCQNRNHKGKKRKFPIGEMFYQNWELTKREMEQAVKEYDVMSLEPMRRFICKNCCMEMKNEKLETL